MTRIAPFVTAGVLAAGVFVGCKSAKQHRLEADKAAKDIIEEKQKAVFGQTEPFTVERPADTLRRRLMLDQDLQYSHPGSLSTKDLKPTKNWPKDDYLSTKNDVPDPSAPGWTGGRLNLNLFNALRVAAYNSREYQQRKEQVFSTALGLDLRRDDFRTQWSGILANSATYNLAPDEDVLGVVSSPTLTARQQFENGLSATARIGLDLVQLLKPDEANTLGIIGDFSVSLPLLAGSGRWLVREPLTQAERDVIYELLEFDQFKRQFAVRIARSYLGVLQAVDSVDNNEQSYRRLVLSARRSRRYADAGRLPEFQVDQALQEELRARERWIQSRQQLAAELDDFKIELGLPPDANLELDRAELANLAGRAQESLRIRGATTQSTQPTGPTTRPAQGTITNGPGPATTQALSTQDVALREPDPMGGPYEIDEQAAIAIALEFRPDLKVAQGNVYDVQRDVAITADALGPGLELAARGDFSDGRGLGSVNSRSGQLRPDEGSYDVSLDLDLPLERTSERNAYRNSLIQLERATRALQAEEDQIKLAIRNQLRVLLRSREGLESQATAVTIALRRVKSTDILLDAGRADVRDVLEAQNSLVEAQNAFTDALVSYRVAELELQRDLGLLAVNHEGQWREYSPEALRQRAAAGPSTRPTAPAVLPGTQDRQ